MAPESKRIIQSSTQCKKEYKARLNTNTIDLEEVKRLERAYELDQRAARARASEKNRNTKQEAKKEKEQRARNQIGIGLATQLAGYSHSQHKSKDLFEAWFGLDKGREGEKRRNDVKKRKEEEEQRAMAVQAISQETENEPRDEEEEEVDNIAQHPVDPESSLDLDDDADAADLLWAQDLHTPNPVEGLQAVGQTTPVAMAAPASAPASSPITTSAVPSKAKPNFNLMHGPTKKVVEDTLGRLPGELVELLSRDVSLMLPDWNPGPNELHRLGPRGMPTHRLRIKVGCVVTLVRDYACDAPLPSGQHLRVVNIIPNNLVCEVLDGPFEGVVVSLCRLPFHGNYRNDAKFPFERTQFPVNVVVDFAPAPIQSEMSAPSKSIATPNSKLDSGFKMPGIPASRSLASGIMGRTVVIHPLALEDLDGFVESDTQIARELSEETTQPPAQPFPKTTAAPPSETDFLSLLSTQDLEFSIDDLEQEKSRSPTVAKYVAVPTIEKETLPGPVTNVTPRQTECLDRDSALLSPRPNPPPVDPRQRRLPKTPSRMAGRTLDSTTGAAMIDLRNLRPSQKPLSVGDRPGLKRKANICTHSPLKRRHSARAPAKADISSSSEDFGMTNQEAAEILDQIENPSRARPNLKRRGRTNTPPAPKKRCSLRALAKSDNASKSDTSSKSEDFGMSTQEALEVHDQIKVVVDNRPTLKRKGHSSAPPSPKKHCTSGAPARGYNPCRIEGVDMSTQALESFFGDADDDEI